MRRYNLFIVSNWRNQDQRDFERIAEIVEELAPDIEALHIPVDRRGRGPRWTSLLRPTLTVAINEPYRFRPLRGRTASHQGGGGKLRQYEVLLAAGLPVPRWIEIGPGTVLDPAEWGECVVEKPSFGRRGALVRLKRSDRVRYQPSDSYPEDHPGRAGPMLAQRFVYTGPQPIAYRVLTCFGEVVMANRYVNTRGKPLEYEEKPLVTGQSIVAAARGCTITLCDEPEVLDLGRACHAAFPDTPLLGADIMRDALDGGLWVAVVNRGHVWSLSTPDGRSAQEEFGLDYYAQFDGLRQAAKGMIAATRRLAR